MLPALPNPNTTHHIHLDNNNSPRPHSQTHHSGSTPPKRNSSMIFRIEHLLPPTVPSSTISTMPPAASALLTTTPNIGGVSSIESITTSLLPAPTNGARRTKVNRTSGVYVKQFAPKDTISETIATLSLLSANYGENPLASDHQSHSHGLQRSHQTSRTYCSIMHGVLRITPIVMRKIKLSEDIHSYNCLFELHDGDVRLRIVRDVVRDEELIAWFDEEVTLFMSIPFLAPINIQGNSRYTCHICHLTFETPNPLKIHLALSCGRHTLDILWIRLHYTLKSTALSQQTLPLPLLHRLPQVSSAQCSSTISASTSSLITSTQAQRLSAFKPISPSSVQVNPLPSTSSTTILPVSTASLSLPLTSHSTNTISFLPSVSSTVTLSPINLLHPPTTNPLNAAAQIEAIVSNMGASKQGHLCIYCGKVYSRKYGLKIHIRTHTGFKPLKCKFCLRPFGDPSNLNKHVRLHLQSGTSSTTGETIDGYKCHLCHKTLARRRDLQRHIESRHNTGS